jgi:hypothetical protein
MKKSTALAAHVRSSAFGSVSHSRLQAALNISLRPHVSVPFRNSSPHFAISPLMLQIAILCRSASHSPFFSTLGNPSKHLTAFSARSVDLITCPALLLSCCARSNASATSLRSETVGFFSSKHLAMKLGRSKASEFKKRTISCRACKGNSNQPPPVPPAPTYPPLRQPGGLSCNGGGMS